jgi:hypothetical protein
MARRDNIAKPKCINYLKDPPVTDAEQMRNLQRLAFDLLEQRLIAGTASSQEVTTIIKEASELERLEIEKKQKEIELLTAKTKLINTQESTVEKTQEVLDELRLYRGQGINEQDVF